MQILLDSDNIVTCFVCGSILGFGLYMLNVGIVTLIWLFKDNAKG